LAAAPVAEELPHALALIPHPHLVALRHLQLWLILALRYIIKFVIEFVIDVNFILNIK
jgi:hypothetical protein